MLRLFLYIFVFFRLDFFNFCIFYNEFTIVFFNFKNGIRSLISKAS